MAAIFSLILEFFLLSQVDNAKDLQAEKQYMTAQIMYSVAKQEQARLVKFDKGVAQSADGKIYTVVLTEPSAGGKSFTFGG